MKAERLGTEDAVQVMSQKASELQRWLEVNEARALAVPEGADLAAAVVPADDLSKQVRGRGGQCLRGRTWRQQWCLLTTYLSRGGGGGGAVPEGGRI